MLPVSPMGKPRPGEGHLPPAFLPALLGEAGPPFSHTEVMRAATPSNIPGAQRGKETPQRAAPLGDSPVAGKTVPL